MNPDMQTHDAILAETDEPELTLGNEAYEADLALVPVAEDVPEQAGALLNPRDYEELLLPAVTQEQLSERIKLINQLITTLLIPGKDYGQIPGTQGNTLLQPGAQKLAAFFCMTVRPTLQDRERVKLDGRWFISYRYKAAAWRGNQLIVETERICNSEEDCFRPWVDAEPPADPHTMTQMLTNKEARWASDSQGQNDKWQEKRAHPNPLGIENMIAARCIKRAYVDAVNKALGLSQYFNKPLFVGKMDGDKSKGANANGASKAPSDAQVFWAKVRANSYPHAEASTLARDAATGKITWEAALKQLDSNP